MDGTFAFEGLRPGTYSVTAWTRSTAAHTLSGVVVRDGAATDIELVLASPGRVFGRVLDEAGAGVPSASVVLWDSVGVPLHGASTTTDATGNFDIRKVPEGKVWVRARTRARVADSALEWVAPGEPAQLELVLRAGTTLRVVLEDGAGEPVQASLSIVDERGFEQVGNATRDERERVLTEGFSSVEWRWGPLPPGRYTISARSLDGRRAETSIVLDGSAERVVRLRP